MLKPITLSESEFSDVLKRVDPKNRNTGAARICKFLADGGHITSRVNFHCSVGNISDLVSKSINPAVQELGLYVACTKPLYRIENKYGQPSGQMIWGWYREAANDETFELEPDLVRLKEEYPDLVDIDGSTPDQWEVALKGAGVE